MSCNISHIQKRKYQNHILKRGFFLSSIHGLKYITEDGRHWSERVVWVLLCVLGFYFTIHFIYPIYSKWNTQVFLVFAYCLSQYCLVDKCPMQFTFKILIQPILTSLESTNYPVWEIDFPGVTICSPNKVNKARMEALANTYP